MAGSTCRSAERNGMREYVNVVNVVNIVNVVTTGCKGS